MDLQLALGVTSCQVALVHLLFIFSNYHESLCCIQYVYHVLDALQLLVKIDLQMSGSIVHYDCSHYFELPILLFIYLTNPCTFIRLVLYT